MAGTLLAVLDVPPIVPITAALIVGLVLLRFVVVPLLARMGMKTFKVVLVLVAVGAALYVSVTYFIASRGAQELEALGTREKDRSDRVLARISGLRGQLTTMGVVTTPMAQGCAGASPMKLDEVVLAYKGPTLRAIEYNTIPSSLEIIGHPRDVMTSYPTTGEIWEEVVVSPLSWEILFPSPYSYLLARHRYAMVVAGDLGALVDLEGDHLVCGGLLAELFKTELGGEGATNPIKVAPLAALCARLEDDMCERVKFTMTAAPGNW